MPASFRFELNPLKKAEQYGRLPPGSLEDEQALVLLDICLTTVEMATGPPVPPVNVGPDGVALKDAFAKELLCVTEVDNG